MAVGSAEKISCKCCMADVFGLDMAFGNIAEGEGPLANFIAIVNWDNHAGPKASDDRSRELVFDLRQFVDHLGSVSLNQLGEHPAPPRGKFCECFGAHVTAVGHAAIDGVGGSHGISYFVRSGALFIVDGHESNERIDRSDF